MASELRVLGARASSLSGILVTESLVVSCAGAVLGILLAALVTVAFSNALEEALGLPFLLPDAGTLAMMAGATVLVSLAAGMISSAFAARRIAKVDVSQILRDE